MRKFLLLISLICLGTTFTLAQDVQEIKIASWKLAGLTNAKSDEDLQLICKVVQQYDLLGLIEVYDEDVLQRMTTILQNDYQKSYTYKWCSEKLAFFYNSSTVSCQVEPIIYPESSFTTKPYYGTFKAGNFDFTVILCQIAQGDPANMQMEMIRLTGLYVYLQTNGTEPDVLMMGNFNHEADEDYDFWGALLTQPGMQRVFLPPYKSSIRDDHLYDNFCFVDTAIGEYLNHGIDKFDESADFNNDDDLAAAVASDRRVIWVRFKTDGHDDD